MAARLSSSASVVIVGAGPVGLALAVGLGRLGIDSIVLERSPTTRDESRAPGVHVRTREVLDHWGLRDRFVGAGTLRREVRLHPAAGRDRALLSLDFGGLEAEAERPGILVIEQSKTERLLLEAARASGRCDVRFRAKVTGLRPRPDGVTVTVDVDGTEHHVEAEYVVGCDGAGSFVREAMGQPFEGRTYALRPVLADVTVHDARDDLDWPRIDSGRGGITAAARLRPGLWRIIRLQTGDGDGGSDDEVDHDEVDHSEVQRRVEEVLGPGQVEVIWASRFRIHRRSSPRFRVGRVLLAGDAAHVHSPVGGQGMNAGIQDAHNLAWKLAVALRGGDEHRLLESYDVERRAVVVGSVSRNTDLVTRLGLLAPAPVRAIGFGFLRAATTVPALRRRLLRRTAMLDLDLPASPLLRSGDRAAGRRLPNVALQDPGGSQARLHDLLPAGASLLDLTAGGLPGDAAAVERTIRIGDGGHRDPTGRLTELLDGEPGCILVRPDVHVAWARTDRERLEDPDGLDAAIWASLGMTPSRADAERSPLDL